MGVEGGGSGLGMEREKEVEMERGGERNVRVLEAEGGKRRKGSGNSKIQEFKEKEGRSGRDG